jgi:hypothetical protein
VVLKRFVANQRDHQSALRRGGGVPPLPLTPDWHGDGGPAAPTVDPDSAYDRAWALTVLAQTLATLSDEQETAGRVSSSHTSQLPAAKFPITKSPHSWT